MNSPWVVRCSDIESVVSITQSVVEKTNLKANKSEDDDGSRAVFEHVDCFRNEG